MTLASPSRPGPQPSPVGLAHVEPVWRSHLPVFEAEPLDEPEATQDQPVDLGHRERPRNSVHVVKELVGQRRIHRLVGDPLVDHGDDHGGEDQVEEGVEEGHARLPPLCGQAVGVLLRHADLDVAAVFPQAAAQRVDQLVLLQEAAHVGARRPPFPIQLIRGGRRRGGQWGRLAIGDPRGVRRRWRVECGHVDLHVRLNAVAVLDQFWRRHPWR